MSSFSLYRLPTGCLWPPRQHYLLCLVYMHVSIVVSNHRYVTLRARVNCLNCKSLFKIKINLTLYHDYIHMYVVLYVVMYVCSYMCSCVYVCICVYVCVYVCIYVHLMETTSLIFLSWKSCWPWKGPNAQNETLCLQLFVWVKLGWQRPHYLLIQILVFNLRHRCGKDNTVHVEVILI